MTATPTLPSDDTTRRPDSDWRLFLRMWPYIYKHRNALVMPLILLVPLALANALQPVLIGQAISLIRQEPVMFFLEGFTLQSGLNLLVGLLVVTVLIRLLLDGFQSYLVQAVGQNITADIRTDLFIHVTSLAVRFFDRTPVGKLITRITSDVDALGDVFSTGAVGIVTDVVSMLVLIVVMFTMQWQLALMLLTLLVPVTWLIIYFQQQFRKANYKSREHLSELNATLQENVAGINVVQLFRRERYNAEMFRHTNQKYITAVDKTIFYDSAVSSTLEWISLVAIGGVLWLGGLLVMQEALTFGTLATFILFAQRLFDPLRQFADKFTAIQAGLTAVERITDLFTVPVEIRDPEKVGGDEEGREAAMRLGGDNGNGVKELIAKENNNLTTFPTTYLSISPTSPSLLSSPPPQPLTLSLSKASEICFDHVTFGYKADEHVLKDLTFTIRPGEKVALVGPTGAGKSSIIRLLCRLYDINQGAILLDGVDIRNLPQAELRRRMAVILQDGFLFAGDVKSNITLGEEYPLEAVVEAAKKTNIHGLIEELPQGYNTELRERGTNLSGGQKQLLAFARAAIRDPGILVLDEATANLDVGTEAMIQEALERLLEGRTAIIIAHRLSTIRHVDRILVLKHGELVEQGSHDELLAREGLYSSLYRLQRLGV
ncbi:MULTISPECIES: ABC transporter ATP-binding protein [Cyanophyceae]|uniref:ABC transporter ATP-binding protein n=1 Tax=Cyanophyceae TaxID=3028117 RepID=UPI00168A28AF|nr:MULTISPECIES: ABC transporter ATP-binding protein [Cyanophyceae]MBD1917667.1 ABC transporter ATP-binding protein [Phormidium sp. FACHB-77]MBD2031135.1 ABC transporter ATP-binding protein [Phormidium sp. FACHB-322]MBD2053564.1 ABC transporter ATP-binding protein [Leptolyngbya sp. FACHB-60]